MCVCLCVCVHKYYAITPPGVLINRILYEISCGEVGKGDGKEVQVGQQECGP